MFTIQEESFGRLTQLELSNVYTGEYVTIIHDYGTAVNELVLKSNGKNQSILKGTHNYKDMVGQKWYKSAKLSPFPNRVKDGKYTFNGKDYKLPLNEEARKHALHGFLYNKPFDLVAHEEGADFATVEFEYNYIGKTAGYPFPYRLSIVYTLTEDGLEILSTIKNTGTEAMPVGDGWHPYFKTGSVVDRLQLCIPKCEMLEVDDRLIPTGKKEAFTHFENLTKIGDFAFDTAFLLEVTNDIVTTELYDAERDLRISLWQETGDKKYNYVQIYIPPDRLSIAIEPMTCAPDAFNNGQGLITLQPHEAFQLRCGISVK